MHLRASCEVYGLATRCSSYCANAPKWLVRLDSNQQPLRYQQSALTVELRTIGAACGNRTRMTDLEDRRSAFELRRHGSRGRVRTCDLPVNGRALYQLSYTQMVGQTIRHNGCTAGHAPCWSREGDSNPHVTAYEAVELPVLYPAMASRQGIEP